MGLKCAASVPELLTAVHIYPLADCRSAADFYLAMIFRYHIHAVSSSPRNFRIADKWGKRDKCSDAHALDL